MMANLALSSNIPDTILIVSPFIIDQCKLINQLNSISYRGVFVRFLFKTTNNSASILLIPQDWAISSMPAPSSINFTA